jgi:hypothetical protein
MAEIAKDLGDWHRLAATPIQVDLTILRDKLRNKMANEMAQEDTAEERKRLAMIAVRKLQELCRPLDEALKAVHPRAELDQMADQLSNTMLSGHHYGTPGPIFSHRRVSKVVSNADARRYAMAYGRGLELLEDGTLAVRAYVMVHFERVMGVDFSWESGDRTAPVGSIESERVLQEVVTELAAQLPAALGTFAEKVPSI